MTTPLELLVGRGIVNAAALVDAARLEQVPLYIAAGFVTKESGGANVYGHDKGGTMFGAGEVTEANFAQFLALVRAGGKSNGVGPLQITWPGFFPVAAERGLRLWVPFDNLRFGLSLIRGYLAGKETDEAIIHAGTRYNGSSVYGQSLLPIARQWQQELAATVPAPPTEEVPVVKTTRNTASQAAARAEQIKTYTPPGQCARFVSDCVSNGTFGYGKVGSARDAWHLATQKEYSWPPLDGAPVYFQTYNGRGRWDHIAIFAGGSIRSTDYPRDGVVGNCSLTQMLQRWPGMSFLGWSRDFAGDPIPGLEKNAPAPAAPPDQPAPPAPAANPDFGSMGDIKMSMSKGLKLSALKPGAVGDPDVARLQSAIWNWRGAGFRKALVTRYPNLSRADLMTGNYGPITRGMVEDCYNLLIEMEGAAKWGKPSDTPGPMLLNRLGFKRVY